MSSCCALTQRFAARVSFPGCFDTTLIIATGSCEFVIVLSVISFLLVSFTRLQHLKILAITNSFDIPKSDALISKTVLIAHCGPSTVGVALDYVI